MMVETDLEGDHEYLIGWLRRVSVGLGMGRTYDVRLLDNGHPVRGIEYASIAELIFVVSEEAALRKAVAEDDEASKAAAGRRPTGRP
jgi:hypothetical protein